MTLYRKLLKVAASAFMLSTAFYFVPAEKGKAAELCSGISSGTIVQWDGDELKLGQIGRLTVLSDTPLYKVAGDSRQFARMLKAGETYRIYAFKPGMLSVGGGYYVDRDTRVKYETPSKTKLGQLECKKASIAESKMPVELTDTRTIIVDKLGTEKRISANEYGTSWYTYHKGYRKYYMISYVNGKIGALYTMDTAFQFENVKVGMARDAVIASLGKPVEGILKGSVSYSTQNDSEQQTFYKNGFYITAFYDIHNYGKVTAIQIVSSDVESRKAGFLASPSASLQQAYEPQLFDLVNASRVRNGLAALAWSEKARLSSRNHSLDMAANNYFSHTNLRGQNPFDRMKGTGIVYRAAGENIAMGYVSSIFAHEGLMNSLGHRRNILSGNYTYLGTGVQFQAGTMRPYYTQNFYKPY
ncbi:CAP-associated domain-containing protein [Bacillus sp. FJAT-27245]|uniref:CAP domain-containing protein n=1 Tax=Bacillus sp. FJAT-27245 TaxID=1684144 RepID=UPI0006A772B2|nr:CAP-associated domain-containing protein [Bacillus sp. FJAT-27245]